MISLGTPLSATAKKVLLCGAGELGKEVVIELLRLGVEVIAVDAYAGAPAMQVAHRSHVVSMLDESALQEVIEAEKPDLVVPEVEAIATGVLAALEAEGVTRVIPTARATQLTMNRESIRTLAAETLGLKTSPYRFAESEDAYREAVQTVGFPCVVKPIMSSSGKEQSTVRGPDEMERAWQYAQEGGRAGKVIVEGFVDFDYEITLLTVRHVQGTSFCQPIGHRQEDGDYRESWQPQSMSAAALAEAERMAGAATEALGGLGLGLFGVELFIKGDEVVFSEVSPRPHDTGLVTLISQDLSEFALHARAILGLPIPNITQHEPSASSVILAEGTSDSVTYGALEKALEQPNTQLRLFGKPFVKGRRRMGVAVARGASIEEARQKAVAAARAVEIGL